MELNKVICGDTLTELKKLPDECVDLIITSPPYFGLRNYQVGGQIGLEKTFEEYLNKILAITAELKRVLKKTGQLWWNHGDCYGGGLETAYLSGKETKFGGNIEKSTITNPEYSQNRGRAGNQKCLLMQPERLAIRMIDEQGWILRDKVKWAKQVYLRKEGRTVGSVMPTSVKDRFNESGEELYFFVKSGDSQYWKNPVTKEIVWEKPKHKEGKEGIDWEWRKIKGEMVKATLWDAYDYWCDLDAVRLPPQTFENRPGGFVRARELQYDSKYLKDYAPFNKQYRVRDAERTAGQPQFRASGEEINKYRKGRKGNNPELNNRNFMPIKYAPADHRGVNDKTEKNYGLKQYQSELSKIPAANTGFFNKEPYKENNPHRVRLYQGKFTGNPNAEMFNSPRARHVRSAGAWGKQTRIKGEKGFRPAENLSNILGKNICSVWQINPEPHNFQKELGVKVDHFAVFPEALCEIPILFGSPPKGIVLDPFCGSGTALLVAKKLGRGYIGIDLQPSYCEIAEKRLAAIPESLL